MVKLLKNLIGSADGIIGFKLNNSIGMSRYKKIGDMTIIQDVFRMESDISLKELCDEWEIDFYE